MGIKRVKGMAGVFEVIPDVTIVNEQMLRDLKGNPDYISKELYKVAADGHKYGIGDQCRIDSMTHFTEYNGDIVEITGIRKDGEYGKCYYVKGRLNEIINWVYENRLIKV